MLDPEVDADAATLIARQEARPEDLPLVVCSDGTVLKNPGDIALGRYLEVLPDAIRERGYDVVVGAGPAGLSTAVYAASEGLSRWAFGPGSAAERAFSNRARRSPQDP